MADPPPPPPPELRILALHSFRTSASIFEDQLRRAGLLTGGGATTTTSEPGAAAAAGLSFAGAPARLDFVEAPNAASGPAPADVAAGGWPPPYREWFAADRIEGPAEGEEGGSGGGGSSENDDGDGGGGCLAEGRRRRRGYCFAGLEQSERLLARALQDARPAYDGIVGFSQGAAMGAAVVAMQLAVRRTGGARGDWAGGGRQGAAREGGGGGRSGAGDADADPWAHVRADLAAAPLPAFLVCIGAAMAPHPRHLQAFRVAGGAGSSGGVGAGGRSGGSGAGRGDGGGAPLPLPLPRPLPLPSAHVIGARDPVRAFSEKLAAAFARPLVLQHARGHVVPRLDAAQVRRLHEFLLLAASGEFRAAGGGGDGGGGGGGALLSRL